MLTHLEQKYIDELTTAITMLDNVAYDIRWRLADGGYNGFRHRELMRKVRDVAQMAFLDLTAQCEEWIEPLLDEARKETE